MTVPVHTRGYVDALDLEPELRRRILMTLGCHDTDPIPKVARAGEVVLDGEVPYQLMHNGVKVVADGYYGAWMTELIRLMRGHHEPQEEKVFHEVLPHLAPGATMVELGSYWAYYSLWFRQAVAHAVNYLFEPDPNHLMVGQQNAALNRAAANFYPLSVGRQPRPARPFRCESDGVSRPVSETSVDEFVRSGAVQRIDLLLADIQGAELAMLEGAVETIRAGKLRFLFLSTHHETMSGDPHTHDRCLAFVQAHGAHLITAHRVDESYSGDGLIAASFDDRDRQLQVSISRNDPAQSLFGAPPADRAAWRRGVSAIARRLRRDGPLTRP